MPRGLARSSERALKTGQRILQNIRSELSECRELFHNDAGWEAFESYVADAYNISSRQAAQTLEFDDPKTFKEYSSVLDLAKRLTEGDSPLEVAEAMNKKNESLMIFELEPLLRKLQTRSASD